MAARGVRVLVMGGEGSALLERARSHAGLETFACRFSGLDFLNPVALARCRAFFVRNRVNRVVLGLPADLKAAGIAARLAGVSGIYYRRGSALPVRDTALNRFLYGQVLTGLIVNSRETARLVLEANPSLLPGERIHILSNGLDVAAFDAAYAAARPLRAKGDVPVIGNAGRLTEQKGQQFLLHMSRALRDRGIRHELVLAGKGEREAELKNLAERLGIADAVVFAGFQADMAPFWRSIDIFVLSSLWEGFGYVLAEALLAGKPAVAFNANSMPEIIRPGETGMLTPPPEEGEDAAAVGMRLADAVQTCLNNPGEAARLAMTGRAFCQEHFDQERCMDALYALLWPAVNHAT